MKINCIYLRRSFGEVKLSSSSRVTLIQKTGGLSGGMIQLNQMPEGQSQMPAGLNQMSEGPSQVPGGLNQSSIKQEGSSSLLGVMESQVCSCSHFQEVLFSSQANVQDTASGSTSPSTLADTHLMRPMDTNQQDRMTKETQTDQDVMEHLLWGHTQGIFVSNFCIFKMWIHLCNYKNNQKESGETQIGLNCSPLTGNIHILTFPHRPVKSWMGLSLNSTWQKNKQRGKLPENEKQGKNNLIWNQERLQIRFFMNNDFEGQK